MIVEGTSQTELRKGPGHFPGSPLPGQAGNAVVAGHRTTYGQPFHNLDRMEIGDLIEVTTVQGDFTYELTELLVTEEADTSVLEDVGDNRITLISCHPKYSRRQRLIGVGELTSNPVPPMESQRIVTGPDANIDFAEGGFGDDTGADFQDELEPRGAVLRGAAVAAGMLVVFYGLATAVRALRRDRPADGPLAPASPPT